MNLGVKFVVVSMDGARTEHKMRPVTQVAAERKFGQSMIEAFQSQQFDKLYWMAWHAATLGTGEYDTWLASVDTIEFDFRDGPEAPTSPARPGS